MPNIKFKFQKHLQTTSSTMNPIILSTALKDEAILEQEICKKCTLF